MSISDDHLRAIGRVAYEWSELELVVDFAIGHSLGVIDPEAIKAITSHISIHVRLDMLPAAAALELEWSSQAIDELKDLVKRIREAAGQRNKVIHAQWRTSEKEGVAIAFTSKARGEVRFHHEEMTAADIEKIATQIRELTGQLHDFINRWHLTWAT